MSELQGKLLELRGCFDRGLLDKKEYDQARAAVLDGFAHSSAPKLSSVDLSASLAELASAITKIANRSAAVTVSFLFVLLLMATMS